MRTTHSAGGVIVNKEGRILVVSQKGDAWKLPGGHVKAGEKEIQAAQREIYEETGIKNLKIIKELGSYKRSKMDCESIDNQEEMKIITIFLFITREIKLESHDKDNPEARWIHKGKVEHILTHPKDKAFFRKIKSQLKEIIKQHDKN